MCWACTAGAAARAAPASVAAARTLTAFDFTHVSFVVTSDSFMTCLLYCFLLRPDCDVHTGKRRSSHIVARNYSPRPCCLLKFLNATAQNANRPAPPSEQPA